MKELFKAVLENIPLYHLLRNWVSKKKARKKIIEWERNGKPVPPPHVVKQRILRRYAKKFGLKVLVETGTYYGEMVEEMKEDFDRIYSIELSQVLYEKAKKRFKSEAHIELIQGDSGIELRNLIGKIDQPALFWLDGHYSAGETAKGDKDTPIYEELTHIFNAQGRGHVIIIDDARCFGGDPAYPSIEELSNFIKSRSPGANIVVEDDSIRIT